MAHPYKEIERIAEMIRRNHSSVIADSLQDALGEIREELERLRISVDWWKGRTADVEAELVKNKSNRDAMRDMWLSSIRQAVRMGIAWSRRGHEIKKLEHDLEYWKTLAETRETELKAKRLRLLASH